MTVILELEKSRLFEAMLILSSNLTPLESLQRIYEEIKKNGRKAVFELQAATRIPNPNSLKCI